MAVKSLLSSYVKGLFPLQKWKCKYSQMFKTFCSVYSNYTNVIPFRAIFLIILGEEKKAPEGQQFEIEQDTVGKGEGQGS